ncbi:MAG: hypothetical protein OXF02_06610 [Simkaniaceae bacterium]|nr:hypothetical protein [Simkaniaceae bacterium]
MSDPLPSLDVVSRRVATTRLSFPRRIAEPAGKVMQTAIPTLFAGAACCIGGAALGLTALSLPVFLLMAPALLYKHLRKPPCYDSPVDAEDPETGYPMDFGYSPEPERSTTPEPPKLIRHDSDYRSEMAGSSRSPDFTDSEDD